MQQPGPDQFCGEIRASAGLLAEIVARYDAERPVPTCPDWTLRQLAAHVGRVHRWAAEIVATRSRDSIPFNSVPDGTFPAEPAARAAWLTAGADRVIAAIQAAGSEPVWAFGTLAPAAFWARRQAHETMVHRADAQLAVGHEVILDPHLAADGIDEWLAMVTDRRYRQRGDGSAAMPEGTVLHVRATGAGAGSGEPAAAAADWLITSSAAGLELRHAAAEADVSVSGPAGRLLLVLVRRLPADDRAVEVTGDAAVLAGWLAGTPF